MGIRYPVDPRDVPPEKAARRLHLSADEFERIRPRLEGRGFPRPDPDTGMYDLRAIDAWMDRRSYLTAPKTPGEAANDSYERMLAKIANL